MATKRIRRTRPDSFGVKHHKDCAFLVSEEDLWTDCTCEPKLNGKPFTHWQNEAREIIVDWLLRGAVNTDERSIIGHMAQRRLLQLAEKESPEILERTREKLRVLQDGMNSILGSIIGQ